MSIRSLISRPLVLACTLLFIFAAGFYFGRSGQSPFAFISATFDISTDPPMDWKLRDTGPFSFYLPPGTEIIPTRGIDSFVEQYRAPDFTLSFDYGWYSDPLKYGDRPHYKRRFVAVDRLPAHLVSFDDPSADPEFPHVFAIHFPNVSPAEKRTKDRLTLYGRCRSDKQYATLQRVFTSVRFANRTNDL